MQIKTKIHAKGTDRMIDRGEYKSSYKGFIASELALVCAVVIIGCYSQRDLIGKSAAGGGAPQNGAFSGEELPAQKEENEEAAQKENAETESVSDAAAYAKVQEDGEYVSEVVVPDGERKFAGKELLLVNPWHLLPKDYEVELEYVEEGHRMDACAAEHMRDMLADCRREGYSPLICSSYRDRKKQETLFANDVRRFISSGMTEEEAILETARNVAVPGSSEHEAGLAADVVYSGRQILDERQADNKTQQWLMQHCWEYGFILRYPEDKQEITGITYEPWHYRYVGEEAAEYIMENGLCLEEYLGIIDVGNDFVWIQESDEEEEQNE